MEFNRCYGCMQIKTTAPVCEYCGYDENQNNSPHQLPVGTILQDQYLIGRTLGQGGFGITYLGWDLALDVPIAVKEFFPSGFVSRDCSISLSVTECEGKLRENFANSRARFLREAKALARFAGIPEIVMVRNFFEANNTAYIIMEYVQGMDLRRYIGTKGGSLSAEETLSILKPVMAALEEVHKAELVHRDISPDNIMLLPNGCVKLLDFGAVRDVENADVEKDLPQSTEAILKHGFAPMEQYQKRGALGPWTDVYALCATAYFCMTGKVPPDAPARIMDDVHPDWTDIADLSETQREALEKGTAVKAKDRTASVRELYEQLFPNSSGADAEQEEQGASRKKKKKRAKGKNSQKKEPQQKAASEGEDENRKKTKKKKKSRFRVSPLLVIACLVFIVAGGIDYLGHYYAPQLFVQEEPAPSWQENKLISGIGESVFGSRGIARDQIRSVTFLDTLKDRQSKSWDASKPHNGSVIAWVQENGEFFDLYVAAEGGINAKDSCRDLFYGYSNLESIHFGTAFHMEGTRDLSRMFSGCSKLKELDLSSFDTSAATDMSRMFYECSTLKQLNLSSFDTANAVNMCYMFYGCEGLETLDVASFDTAKVTNMSHMFYRVSGTVEIDLSRFLTHKVTASLNFMNPGKQINGAPWDNLFLWKINKLLDAPEDTVFGAKISRDRIRSITFLDTLKNAPRNSWDASATKDRRVLAWTEQNGEYYDLFIAGEGGVCSGYYSADLFSGYSNVESIEFGNAFYIEGAVSLANMFWGCSNLVELDLSCFRTEDVTNFSGMFKDCSRLRKVNLSSFITDKVTTMWGMFWNCTNLKEVDVSHFCTENVVTTSYMFRNCSSLKKLDVSSFDLSKVKNVSYMFAGTTNNVIFSPELDLHNVISYRNFMNYGAKVNDTPWEELFIKESPEEQA